MTEFDKNQSNFDPRFNIYININDLRVGEMLITIESQHVWINRMYNLTLTDPGKFESIGTLKHVGSALFEIAFQISLKEGKNGCVELISTNWKTGTPEKFYKMGFRCKDTAFKKDFVEAVHAYLNGLREDDQISLICDHSDYYDFQKNASKILKIPTNYLSFERPFIMVFIVKIIGFSTKVERGSI